MSASSPKPIWFLPPGDKMITDLKSFFDLNEQTEKTAIVSEDYTVVDEPGIPGVVEIVGALQHYPHLIEKMMFGIEIQFCEPDNEEAFIPEEVWKTQRKYYSWFHRIYDFPPALFFLNDHEARFYALAGDMLAEVKWWLLNKSREKASRLLALHGSRHTRLETALAMLPNCCMSIVMLPPAIRVLISKR
jgi:hypothetical protein